MNLTSTVILQIIIFYCLVVAVQRVPIGRSIRIAAWSIPMIIGLCWYFWPAYTLAIGLGLWLSFVLLPLLLFRRLRTLTVNRQFGQARLLALWLRWLAPTDGMMVYPHILQGLQWWQAGETQAAEEVFAQYRSDRRLMPRTAIALSYRLAARWEEYLDWIHNQMSSSELDQDRSSLKAYYLRALGETSHLAELLTILTRVPDQPHLQEARLFTLAFCGWVPAVQQIVPYALRNYPPVVGDFWVGTAKLAAGEGADQLLALQSSTDRTLQQDLSRRLTHPLPDLHQLNPHQWEMVTALAETAQQEINQDQQLPTHLSVPGTNLLLFLNIGIFAAEAFWQHLHPTQLPWLAWGGLIAPAVVAGEGWRLVSANFLHLGILHLVMNMLGLSYLGRFVEHRLGTGRFLLAYGIAGIGAMGCVTFADLMQRSEQVTVGASGAIMGLLGVMGAIHLLNWVGNRGPLAVRELRSILLAVGFQLLFDITNGHTSIVGHFTGLAIGIFVGLILTATKP